MLHQVVHHLELIATLGALVLTRRAAGHESVAVIFKRSPRLVQLAILWVGGAGAKLEKFFMMVLKLVRAHIAAALSAKVAVGNTTRMSKLTTFAGRGIRLEGC